MSDPSAHDPTRELLRRVVANEHVASAALPPSVWMALLGTSRLERVEGALVEAIEDGRLPATDAQSQEAFDALADQMSSCVALESLAISVIRSLTDRGLRPCLLKGLATAHLDYRKPWMRFFADADLLVRSTEIEAAYETLGEVGFQRRFVEPVPGFDREFGKGTAFTADDGREIDLHRTFTMGALGMSIDETELWADLDTVVLGGESIAALGRERRFLHACLHVAATTGRPKLSSLRDIAALSHHPDGLDLVTIRELSASWRYDAVIEKALTTTASALSEASVEPLCGLRRDLQSSRWDRIVLSAYTDHRIGYAGRSLVAIPAIRSWSARARFVRALALPGGAYLDHGRNGRSHRWLRGFHDLRRLLRRSGRA